MRPAKLGILAALIVVTGLALLWVTEAVPRDDLWDMAPKALGAVAILTIAGIIWSSMRGSPHTRDDSDKPVP
jgi:hypothetical protein